MSSLINAFDPQWPGAYTVLLDDPDGKVVITKWGAWTSSP